MTFIVNIYLAVFLLPHPLFRLHWFKDQIYDPLPVTHQDQGSTSINYKRGPWLTEPQKTFGTIPIPKFMLQTCGLTNQGLGIGMGGQTKKQLGYGSSNQTGWLIQQEFIG